MFKLSAFINIPAFIISLSIGILFVYLGNEGESRQIFVYPSPENSNILQYKDRAGTCFQYKQTKVSCPSNPKDISKIPIQS